MKQINCLIIDDEPLAHTVILEYAKDVSFLDIKGQCYLATEAFTFLKNEEIDLIFLDINMPKIKGLDFLRTLQKKPIVIITSAYQEYALESFELNVCDYLLKPFRFDRFLKASNKAFELFELKNVTNNPIIASSSSSNEDANQLFIKSDKRFVQVNLAEVFYIESYGNYIKVWLEKEYHLTAQTLTSFEQQVPDSDFFKIHKSFIVNKKHIDYVEGNMVVMKNGKTLVVGKNYRRDFKAFITEK